MELIKNFQKHCWHDAQKALVESPQNAVMLTLKDDLQTFIHACFDAQRPNNVVWKGALRAIFILAEMQRLDLAKLIKEQNQILVDKQYVLDHAQEFAQNIQKGRELVSNFDKANFTDDYARGVHDGLNKFLGCLLNSSKPLLGPYHEPPEVQQDEVQQDDAEFVAFEAKVPWFSEHKNKED